MSKVGHLTFFSGFSRCQTKNPPPPKPPKTNPTGNSLFARMVCKPDSVPDKPVSDHSSGTPIAGCLMRPTRMTRRRPSGTCVPAIPIRPCFRRGLPCRQCRHRRGGLLPHRFTHASPANHICRHMISRRGGLFSVALSLGLLRPDVIRRRFFMKSGLSSPKFRSGRPTIRAIICTRPW